MGGCFQDHLTPLNTRDRENINTIIENLCKSRIEDYESRLSHAYKVIDRMRCPLQFADSYLYDEIIEVFDEYCFDNDIDAETLDFDPEEMIFA